MKKYIKGISLLLLNNLALLLIVYGILNKRFIHIIPFVLLWFGTFILISVATSEGLPKIETEDIPLSEDDI